MHGYKRHILKFREELAKMSFVVLSETDFSIVFTNDDVLITFSVEPYANYLEVSVEYLSEPSHARKSYRLDLVMRLYHTDDLMLIFSKYKTDEEKEIVVRTYYQFIEDHADAVFGKRFPEPQRYEEVERKERDRLRQIWEKRLRNK